MYHMLYYILSVLWLIDCDEAARQVAYLLHLVRNDPKQRYRSKKAESKSNCTFRLCDTSDVFFCNFSGVVLFRHT